MINLFDLLPIIPTLRNDGIGRKSLLDFHIAPVIEIFGSWMILKNNILKPALNVAMMRASALGLISKWRNDPIVSIYIIFHSNHAIHRSFFAVSLLELVINMSRLILRCMKMVP